MTTREPLLATAQTPRRLRAMEREQTAFSEFIRRTGVLESTEALILYLTYLAHVRGLSGKAVRRRLTLLDLSRRVAGETPWGGQVEVQTFLRGLHHDKPLGPTNERSDPVYPETLHALVDAVMLPRHDQLRDRALLLLANETLWPAAVLCR